MSVDRFGVHMRIRVGAWMGGGVLCGCVRTPVPSRPAVPLVFFFFSVCFAAPLPLFPAAHPPALPFITIAGRPGPAHPPQLLSSEIRPSVACSSSTVSPSSAEDLSSLSVLWHRFIDACLLTPPGLLFIASQPASQPVDRLCGHSHSFVMSHIIYIYMPTWSGLGFNSYRRSTPTSPARLAAVIAFK